MRLTRRTALLGLASAVMLGRASLAVAAAPTARRLIVVLLRGGLDGLAVVVPRGDPDLAGWRAPLVPEGLLDLGGIWGLHPGLAGLHGLYAAGELLAVQAVASPDRSRSHFAAQDTLELGAAHGISSGWLNRAAALVPDDGPERALAVGPAMPLLLRGPTPTGSWQPAGGSPPPADFYATLRTLYRDDPLVGPALARALDERGLAAAALGGADPAPHGGFAALCAAAGRLLAAPAGARIAALELGGWDTHVNQPARLAAALRPLDEGLMALRRGLGDTWRETAVLVVTEFGRTVRMNGAHGTDHGTATLALLLGGNVAGGRVSGDWPGLRRSRLFENRDLQPTADVRSLAKGVLAQHFGLDGAALDRVFPASPLAPPLPALLRG